MGDNLIRRACDRCHDQKLSCKRIGDGICERCMRLNTECKSSPSLRYKKHLRQHDEMSEPQQGQQPPPHQPPHQRQHHPQHHPQPHPRELQQQSPQQLQQPKMEMKIAPQEQHQIQHQQGHQQQGHQQQRHQQQRHQQQRKQQQQPQQQQRHQQRHHQQQHQSRIDYSQTQRGVLQTSSQPHHSSQQLQERRKAGKLLDQPSPKRRRTGSEARPVQHEAAPPILPVVTDVAYKTSTQGYLVAEPGSGPELDAVMGLGGFDMNLQAMDFTGPRQSSMPPEHLLTAQGPPMFENCVSLPQVLPSPWPSNVLQQNSQQQQLLLQEYQQLQQVYQQKHLYQPHHQHQAQLDLLSQAQNQSQVFPHQSSASALTVPNPAFFQQPVQNTVTPLPPYQQKQPAAAVFGDSKGQSFAVPNLAAVLSQAQRRSRSNRFRPKVIHPASREKEQLPQQVPKVKEEQRPVAKTAEKGDMANLYQVELRLRILSLSLYRLEGGEDHDVGRDGKPNEFTVAELYRHTHYIIDVLQCVEGAKSSAGAGDGNGSDSAPASGGGVDTSAPASSAPPAPPLAPIGNPAEMTAEEIYPDDPANNMFMLSLYVRIVDVFQRLFTLVRAQLATADPKRDDTFAYWLLPEMNIGSASIGAHPVFHMSLTVQLAMQFLARLREVTASLGVTQQQPGPVVNAVASAGNDGPSAQPQTSSSSSSLTSSSSSAGAAAGAGAQSATQGATDSSLMAGVVKASFQAMRNQEASLDRQLEELKTALDDFMDTMDAIDAIDAIEESGRQN